MHGPTIRRRCEDADLIERVARGVEPVVLLVVAGHRDGITRLDDVTHLDLGLHDVLVLPGRNPAEASPVRTLHAGGLAADSDADTDAVVIAIAVDELGHCTDLAAHDRLDRRPQRHEEGHLRIDVVGRIRGPSRALAVVLDGGRHGRSLREGDRADVHLSGLLRGRVVGRHRDTPGLDNGRDATTRAGSRSWSRSWIPLQLPDQLALVLALGHLRADDRPARTIALRRTELGARLAHE